MILTHRMGGPSARLLRDKIQEVTGVHLFVTSHSEKVKKLHVRYGNYARLPFETNYNRRDFVVLCSSKIKFSKLLRENGYDAPHFKSKTLPTEDDYPVLIRTTLNSRGGRGTIPCPNEETFDKEWQTGYYWTRFIKTKAEYRVHIFDNEVMKLFKKVYTGEGNEPDFPIRTLTHQPYHFSLRSNYNKFPKLLNVLGGVTKLLNGGFYVLDAAWQPDVKRYFFFEANSAPGLNQYSALEMAKRLHNVGAV